MTERVDRGMFVRGLKVIWSYVKMHPGPFTTAVCGAAVFAVATVASALVLGKVTDEVIVPVFEGTRSNRDIVIGALAILAVAAVRSLAILARRYFAGMTTARVQRSLRMMVLRHYRDLPLSFHRSQPAGELLAHVDADVLAASDVLHPLPFSTASLLLIVIAVVALVVTDPFLAVIGLLVLPLLTLLNRSFGTRIEPPARRAQEALGRLSAFAHESFDGALVVKTLGREEDEVGDLAARAENVREHRTEFGRIRAGFDPAFETLPNLGILVLLAVGSWRVSTGAVSVGVLVQFVSLFQLLAFPMRLIGWVLADMPRAVVGRGRLEDVLNIPPRKRREERAEARLPDGALGVDVDALTFAYDGHRVLDEVSFSVTPKGSVALVGPTGSGKTTLAQLLVALEDPSSGRVRVGGVDVATLPAKELNDKVAIVFQESFLFATTVRENITLGRSVTDAELHKVAELAQAHRFIQALPHGYDTVVGERGVTLSGGQRQRIALARALLRNPCVLILDDATSSVDPTIEAEILRGLSRDLETTLIVIAHRLSTITLADRVLFLNHGSIEAVGTHDEMLEHPGYRALVRAYEDSAA